MKNLWIKTLIAALICSPCAQAWAHGGADSGSMAQPRSEGSSPSDTASVRQEELASLQKKIDKLDEKLEDETLPAKKRAKLEKSCRSC
ncbi:MAG: hypothetical protein M0D55_06855 [Elusimicrobiota bacterium]|nr:MAG: hypothetical protein M0D55_06855 [Elusimicrobiota bacterium]